MIPDSRRGDAGQVDFHPVFRADRAFIFLIRDRNSGTLLFLGRLQCPGIWSARLPLESQLPDRPAVELAGGVCFAGALLAIDAGACGARRPHAPSARTGALTELERCWNACLRR
ncbi:MAG: hypothetical protein IPH76_18975 [Xanthomonadales bacterium]|nr:hypothetical protein [Xanthomonadales bacterium]